MTGIDVVRVRLRIRGRVQGVFYRDSTRHQAEMHGVSGWVRNLPDGDVEAVLEGRSDAVRAVVSFCERGPRGAFVTGVDVAEEDPQGETGFGVRF